MSGISPTENARVALLTGAGSPRGIGRATADQLVRDGWNVAILDIDGEAAQRAADELQSQAPNDNKVVGVRVDVSDPTSVDDAVAEVEHALPPITALANLAGISSPTSFLEISSKEWDRVLAVNLTGAFFVSQRVVRGMIDRRYGRIVNISSISAQRGGGTYSKVAYSASKAGLLGFTRALAREVGEFGVTVNAVAPGPIDTDIMGGTLTASRKAELSEGTIMGRIGTPFDVAALVCFLFGESAGYITAATYDVNGGLQIS